MVGLGLCHVETMWAFQTTLGKRVSKKSAPFSWGSKLIALCRDAMEPKDL